MEVLLGSIPALTQGQMRVIVIPSVETMISEQLDAFSQLTNLSTDNPSSHAETLLYLTARVRQTLEDMIPQMSEELLLA
eukprot:35068-Rhodomonas_salina.2